MSLCNRAMRLKSLHRDEQGTISIVTVFTMLLFTMLLVMVTNVSRHADDKIRLQNANDAASQTGAVTLARGMNSLVFTNHLLCEVFALTAYMREAKAADQGTASLVPEILAEWDRSARAFEQAGQASGYAKFEQLGAALQQKIPLEQQVVDDFVVMAQEHSRLTLPVFEYILGGPDWSGSSGGTGTGAPPDPEGGFIPRFQRAVVQNTTIASHLAANEIAKRHGRQTLIQHGNRPLEYRLWRTDARMMGMGEIDENDPITRTMPVIDPSPAGPDSSISLMPAPYDTSGRTYFEISLQQRRDISAHYLKLWISDWMKLYFDFGDDNGDFVLHGPGDGHDGMTTAKMSNLLNLWRAATCEHLNTLLNDEYPFTNVPCMLRNRPQGSNVLQDNQIIEQEYSFIGVTYWTHLTEMAPGVFKNPLQQAGQQQAGTLAFAQASIYVPKARLTNGPTWVYWVWNGQFYEPRAHRDNWPQEWSMINQNWMARIRPATSESIVQILQQGPGSGSGYQPLMLNGVTMEEIRAINTH